MKFQDSTQIIKSLADSSRLRIVNSLLESPHYVEELAERLNLAVSTVSFHLKKLEEAGLVRKEKQQYYVMFFLNPDIFQLTLAELVSFENSEKVFQAQRIEQYRQKVINTFFPEGKLLRLPSQHKKRWIVLEEIARNFETGRKYTEAEINEMILKFYHDYCTIRRDLVDEKIMLRDGHHYWLNEQNKTGDCSPYSFEHSFRQSLNLSEHAVQKTKAKTRKHQMNRKQVLKNSYKQQQFPMGVFQLKNLQNGKILIGSSLNLPAMWNRLQAELKIGSHLNRLLQQEWQQFGPENFTYEVLETFPPHNDDPAHNYTDELALLEQIWLEKLQPFGEKGYNQPVKQR